MDTNKIKNYSWLLMFILFSLQLQAQTYYKFIVRFQDKGSNNPFNINQPVDFLSQRAIDRRIKFNIPVTAQDLPVHPDYIAGVLNISPNLKLFNRSRWMNHIMVGTYDSTLVSSIASLNYVDTAFMIYRGGYPQKPSGSTIQSNGGVKSINESIEDLNYGDATVQIQMIGLDYLHRKGFLGEGMQIAVFDGGFSFVHLMPAFEHLRQNNQIMGTWDFVTSDSSVYEDNNHGMNVLSCMAAYIPGKMLGTAPKASYWLLRTEDVFSETVTEEYHWLSASEFADSAGVDLVNSSLGYTTFDNGVGDYSYNDMDGNKAICTRAADILSSKGVLVVNSAGNSGNSEWKYIGAPADADSVLAIGAVKSDRQKASFSSFGPSVDGRIKPDVCAMGQATKLVAVTGDVISANGTSFSSPIMCGAIACFWQKHPSMNNMQIIQAVKESANFYQLPNDEMGYGIPNFGVADMLIKQTNFDQYYEDQKITVYPNPVTDNIFYVDFYSNATENVIIEVMSVKGKKVYVKEQQVYQKSMNTFVLSIDQKLASGSYILSIQTKSKRFTSKFIKS
jgi:serine protease AprX